MSSSDDYPDEMGTHGADDDDPVSDLVAELRSWPARPAPTAHGELARVLTEGLVRGRRGVAIKAALSGLVVVASVGTLGAFGVLPAAADHLVQESIVAVSPIDFDHHTPPADSLTTNTPVAPVVPSTTPDPGGSDEADEADGQNNNAVEDENDQGCDEPEGQRNDAEKDAETHEADEADEAEACATPSASDDPKDKSKDKQKDKD